MTDKKESLGDRIKRYEAVSDYKLMNKCPVIIRIDGKAFHTFTRGMQKPFDSKLIEAMVSTGEKVSKQMMGFVFGYHQSDEFTFLVYDGKTIQTQSWFDNDLPKLVSITASMFTAYFNQAMGGTTAVFDARAFNVPLEEVPNVFIWRQRDWERNSLQMFCRSKFSHKQLIGKSKEDMHEMLHSLGENWANLSEIEKNGTFIVNTPLLLQRINKKMDYQEIKQILTEYVSIS